MKPLVKQAVLGSRFTTLRRPSKGTACKNGIRPSTVQKVKPEFGPVSTLHAVEMRRYRLAPRHQSRIPKMGGCFRAHGLSQLIPQSAPDIVSVDRSTVIWERKTI